jgi:hypothetical protein
MHADAVKARYDLVLAAENDQVYRIQIWPKQAIDRDSFSVAVVDLNKQKFLPDALHLLSPNGKDMQRFYFTRRRSPPARSRSTASGKILTNAPINDANFEGKPWPNWKVVVNPANNAQPPTAGAPARAPHQAACHEPGGPQPTLRAAFVPPEGRRHGGMEAPRWSEVFRKMTGW